MSSSVLPFCVHLLYEFFWSSVLCTFVIVLPLSSSVLPFCVHLLYEFFCFVYIFYMSSSVLCTFVI